MKTSSRLALAALASALSPLAFAHALLVVPVIILIGAGFSHALDRAAPWLVLPRFDAIPHWAYVALAVLAIDAVDWLAQALQNGAQT